MHGIQKDQNYFYIIVCGFYVKATMKKKCKRESKDNVTFLNLNLVLFLSTSLRSYEIVLLVQAPLLVTWKQVAPVTTKSTYVSQLIYVPIFSEK